MAKRKEPVAVVEAYQRETGWDITVERFINASLHLSTEGTLVIRRGQTTAAIKAFSSGTWHTAYMEGSADGY